MNLSETHRVPRELALLYDFANSLDRRGFVEHGEPHEAGDELATAAGFETWMRDHGLLGRGWPLRKGDRARAIALREALRAFLALAPTDRPVRSDAAARLAKICSEFPLVVSIAGPVPTLEPAPGSSPLGLVVAQLQALGQAHKLDRVKLCASDDCHWLFFDRSRPGNRRWCSSALCGNRHKTRAYRERLRSEAP